MSTPVDKTLRLDRTQLSQKKPSNRPPTMVLALIAGLAAAALVFFLLNGRSQQPAAVQAPPPPTTVPMIVAAQNIPMHQRVTEAMLVTANVPKDQAPADGISSVQEAIGKVTVGPILAKQTLTRPLLTDPGIGLGLSFAIPTGMRAVTIALDSLSSVAGFVKPHDHVDVVGTFDAGQGQSVTRTVLQNIELLATGSQVLPDRPVAQTNNTPVIGGQQQAPAPEPSQPIEVPNATVLVTPIDAQKLILSAAKGKLQLSLRPSDDMTRTPLPNLRSTAVTGATLIPAAITAPIPRPVAAPPIYSAPPAPVTPMPTAPPPPTVATITVIRGSDSKSVTVSP